MPRRSTKRRSSRRRSRRRRSSDSTWARRPRTPTELNTETLTLEKPAQLAQEAEFNDASQHFEHRGGGMPSDSKQPNVGGFGGFDVQDLGGGPSVKGKGGVGVGIGTGTHAGSGGSGWGFGGRGSGSRKAMLASGGGTKQSERAVAAAAELARPPSTLRRQLEPSAATKAVARTALAPVPARPAIVRPPPPPWPCCLSSARAKRTSRRVFTGTPLRPESVFSSKTKNPTATCHRRRHVRPGPGHHHALRMLWHEQR